MEMKFEKKNVKIRELVDGFQDKGLEGVIGYGGKLNIRPPYQREFVYKDKQRNAVIDTVLERCPLSNMYWAKNEDGSLELLDGQQRTLSICKYYAGEFSVKDVKSNKVSFFQNLPSDKKEKFLDYEISIDVCSGGESEKLEWFERINTGGEKLTKQELRNAAYTGSWVEDAKRYFSKPQCVAYKIGADFMTGNAIRQDYLETAIKWISNGDIEGYMSKHQHDPNASQLWRYFQDVMTWMESIFPSKYNKKRKKFMKGIDWGILYNSFKDEMYDVDKLEEKIRSLILDDDVTSKKGIYSYLLTRDAKHLSIRAFTPAMKISVYEKQNGVCVHCGKTFGIDDMEADHITPWHKGGKTTADNCQLLCKNCNRTKGGK